MEPLVAKYIKGTVKTEKALKKLRDAELQRLKINWRGRLKHGAEASKKNAEKIKAEPDANGEPKTGDNNTEGGKKKDSSAVDAKKVATEKKKQKKKGGSKANLKAARAFINGVAKG